MGNKENCPLFQDPTCPPPPPPILGPREGKGDEAISNFVPFSWGPPEGRGYVANPHIFWPPRRQG